MITSLRITRAAAPPPLKADWQDCFWQAHPMNALRAFMGERPVHFPDTQFRLAYDDANLYVIFHVQDRYVKACAHRHQDPVYRDSCVELFFTPGGDVSAGYFNLEINCGGFVLFHHQTQAGGSRQLLPQAACDQLRIAHTAPKRIEQEIAEPYDWCVEVALPLALLDPYAKVEKPGPGVVWRGNAYKCADDSSHPHWLSWAPVEHPTPNFHLPAYFGEFVFD